MTDRRKRPTGKPRGKRADPNFKPLVSITQNIVNGDLYLGFSYGKGVEVKRGTDDWLDTVELLEDLCPGRLGVNKGS